MTAALFGRLDALLRGIALLGMVVLGGAILLTLADIVTRSLSDNAIGGTVDVTQLCVMACAWWGIPFAFARSGHVRLEVGETLLPPRLRHGLDALASLLGAVFVGLIAWYGWDSAALAADYGDVSQNVAIPMTVYWGFLLSGAVLSVLACLVIALRHGGFMIRGDET